MPDFPIVKKKIKFSESFLLQIIHRFITEYTGQVLCRVETRAKRSVTRVVFPCSEYPQDYFGIALRIAQCSRQEPLIYRKKLKKPGKIGLIIKNHKKLAFRWICAKIFFVHNTEAVAQWQSACLWNKMLWVRDPPASLGAFSRLSLRVISVLVN